MRHKKQLDYRVFISHSSKDLWICERMRDQIEAAGITVWLDAVDLEAGSAVSDSILKELRKSSECLILLSPTSKSSDWVLAEIGMAMMASLKIVPVLLHVDRSELPGTVRNLSPIDLNDFQEYLRQLKRRVQTASRTKQKGKA